MEAPGLAALVPDGVAVRETDDPAAWARGLLPAEAPAVARAVPRRRTEFEAGRNLARAALADLGLPGAAVPVGQHRSPVWPAGVVGSLTHCAGYCAAAVAPASRLGAVGVDAERRGRASPEIGARISLPAERRRLGADLDEGEWPTVLFSAKEAIYKAWWPVHRRWLGYEDADVSVDVGDGTFTARILVDHDPVFARLAGRVAIAGDLVLAAAWLPPRPGGCGQE